MNWPFPRAAYIDHDADFHQVAQELATEPLVAIDTESNSLHAYRERVCLIQISTRTADYIIDPLRIADLSPLGPIFANPAIEKVFHAAEYDLMCMRRDYGFRLVNLFDTMVAARITGHKAIGLSKLLAEYCGVEGDKSHQRDDWGQRPLSEEGLLYAQMDTHYLPILRDHLLQKLIDTGRLEEAQETFAESCDVPPANNVFDPDGYWRIGLPADLNRRQMAVLRELYLLRDRIAQERDVPPFKVFSNQVLVAIAEMLPNSSHSLNPIKGMSPQQVRRYGRDLMAAVERGKRATIPKPPPRPADIPPETIERYTALHEWRKTRAEARGVESDVIISKEALWEVARRNATTPDDLTGIIGLGPVRLAAYGADILTVMRQFQDGAE